MAQSEKKKSHLKKIIIVIVLILILGAVGYLNYLLNTGSEPNASGIPSTPSATPSMSPDADSDVDVDLEALALSKTFFDDFRKERAASLEKEIQYLDAIINDKNTDKETLADAQQRKMELASSMETETTLEGLIKAKGFADAIVTISKGSVNVIVKTATLTQQQAAQIMDVVKRESGESGENIKIITRQ
jgi:stage III sporulation protein AH